MYVPPNYMPPRIDPKEPNVTYPTDSIRTTFESADKNGDGKLSKTEVKEAFAKLGAFCPDYRAWKARRHADANHDGFISLDEELKELVNYTQKQGYKAK
ncbi:hypothetical protein M0R45_011985 [Rubus argutus]|uniref:EF-hand domain-containing protein n=1 Tax=Rubus argutus TaxID=59490 RepID=A0AAW1YCM6_RUBAR